MKQEKVHNSFRGGVFVASTDGSIISDNKSPRIDFDPIVLVRCLLEVDPKVFVICIQFY